MSDTDQPQKCVCCQAPLLADEADEFLMCNACFDEGLAEARAIGVLDEEEP